MNTQIVIRKDGAVMTEEDLYTVALYTPGMTKISYNLIRSMQADKSFHFPGVLQTSDGREVIAIQEGYDTRYNKAGFYDNSYNRAVEGVGFFRETTPLDFLDYKYVSANYNMVKKSGGNWAMFMIIGITFGAFAILGH